MAIEPAIKEKILFFKSKKKFRRPLSSMGGGVKTLMARPYFFCDFPNLEHHDDVALVEDVAGRVHCDPGEVLDLLRVPKGIN